MSPKTWEEDEDRERSWSLTTITKNNMDITTNTPPASAEKAAPKQRGRPFEPGTSGNP